MNAWLPFFALVKRELLSALRSGRVYALMVLTLSITSAIVLLVIVNLGRNAGGMLSETLLLTLTFCFYGAALLLLPPLAAVSICMEKQRDTWPLLQTSLVPPWQIVLVKLLHILVIYLFIIVSCLPLSGVVFFFVGINFAQFYNAMAVVAMTGIAATAWSVMCSAFFYRIMTAITAAYIGVILLVTGAGWLLLCGMLGSALSLTGNAAVFVQYDLRGFYELSVQFLCPSYGIITAVSGRIGSSVPADPWASCPYLAIVSVVACCVAARLVRRPPRPIYVNQRKTIDDTQQLEDRRKRFPYYLIDPQRGRRPISDHRNPMYAKELFAGAIGRGTLVIRIAYCISVPFVFYSLFLTFTIESNRSDANLYSLNIVQRLLYGHGFSSDFLTFQMLQGCILLILAPALMANCVVKEYELGNMDMLRMTLLKPHQIVLGKLAGGAAGLAVPAVGMTLGSLPLVMAILLHPYTFRWTWVATGAAYISALILVLCLTLCVSAACRSLTSAMVSSYFAAIVLLLFLPYSLIMLGEALGFPTNDLLQLMACLPSPPVHLLARIEHWRDGMNSVYWNALVTLVFSLALYFTTVWQFRRSHMREK